MMRWLASRSSEYCFCDNTALPSLCGAARSCPESGEYAAPGDTSSVRTSMWPRTPDAVCGVAYSPTAFSGAHRKRPASAAPREFGYMLPAAVWGGRYDTRPGQPAAGFPRGQTRRRIPWDHWRRVDSHIGELLFFRLEPGVIAFFPGLRPSKFNLFLMKNPANGFQADRTDHFLPDQVFPQLFQRPAFKRAAQQIRRTFGGLRNKGLVIFGKFFRSAGAGLGFQGLKTTGIEFLNNGSNVVFRIVNQLCNRRDFIALIRSQYHLSTPSLDAAGTATHNPLNLLTFGHRKVSGVQTHKKSLSMFEYIDFFLRVCLYNTQLYTAQVQNLKMLILFF